MRRNIESRGFTIVELLIVIVVIAILAAITIASYNGVQQRANNTAIIDAASKTYRMIQAYIATKGSYPLTAAQSCVTSTSGCQVSTAIGANATFDTNIATVGTLPRSIPSISGSRYGIIYSYDATRLVGGAPQPGFIYYWLSGLSQQCGMPVTTTWGNTTAHTAPSSTGYTLGNDYGGTLCIVNIPGPST